MGYASQQVGVDLNKVLIESYKQEKERKEKELKEKDGHDEQNENSDPRPAGIEAGSGCLDCQIHCLTRPESVVMQNDDTSGTPLDKPHDGPETSSGVNEAAITGENESGWLENTKPRPVGHTLGGANAMTADELRRSRMQAIKPKTKPPSKAWKKLQDQGLLNNAESRNHLGASESSLQSSSIRNRACPAHTPEASITSGNAAEPSNTAIEAIAGPRDDSLRLENEQTGVATGRDSEVASEPFGLPPDLPQGTSDVPAAMKEWMQDTHAYTVATQKNLEKLRKKCEVMKSCECQNGSANRNIGNKSFVSDNKVNDKDGMEINSQVQSPEKPRPSNHEHQHSPLLDSDGFSKQQLRQALEASGAEEPTTSQDDEMPGLVSDTSPVSPSIANRLSEGREEKEKREEMRRSREEDIAEKIKWARQKMKESPGMKLEDVEEQMLGKLKAPNDVAEEVMKALRRGG